MSDGTEQRVQLDRPGVDPDRPVAGAADGATRQPGEDPRQPDSRDVAESGPPPGGDEPGPDPRIEFYRGLNRLERGQLAARDDVLREIGMTVTIVGAYATIAGYLLYSEARRREKARRKGLQL